MAGLRGTVFAGSASAVTGTATPLSTTSKICDHLILKAVRSSNVANGAVVYIGGSDVTAALGIPVDPMDSMTIKASYGNTIDLADIYILGTTADMIKFFGSRRP